MSDIDEQKYRRLERMVERLQAQQSHKPFGHIISYIQGMYGLRFFWIFGARGRGFGVPDFSGLGHTLSVGNWGLGFGSDNFRVPYLALNGNGYMFNAYSTDMQWLNQNLTASIYCWPNPGQTGDKYIFCQDDRGFGQRVWAIVYDPDNQRFKAWVSGDGTTISMVNSTNGSAPPSAWYCLQMRWTINNSLVLFVNKNRYFQGTVPADLAGGNANLTVGAAADGNQGLNGSVALAWAADLAAGDDLYYEYFNRSRSYFKV